ncbi:transcriptional regulator with XRE-family HTH domain [Allocatelliglobosispora scoriae]|uniref:Transcriptional regulator with XRE-family HTH domain n=1 Tax=Allocatelliglobosispora scoriae TaxID=643052 RepID=A0A841C0E4_9ACTN|nr:helix-turn-helix domain-containing protein [Allocatelliglobosispora scoriae]MBB5872420.1 transcriptional regulator with XRE-family HTH domain [Allocatelliglobosispora scoriae]
MVESMGAGATEFSGSLRAAIQRSGLSLDDLARRLRERETPLSASTISYWQTGATQPERLGSLAALAALEEILGVPSGALAALVGPRRPRGSWLPKFNTNLRYDAFWYHPESVLRVLAKVDATPDDLAQPLKLSQSVAYRIDAQGCEESIHVRRIVRADRDDTRRVIFVSRCATLPQPPTVTFAEGCRPARFRADVPSSTCVFEFLLDYPLAAGELAMIEFGLRYPPGQHQNYIRLEISRPSRDLTLQVSFDPSRVPARCYSHYQPRNTLPVQRIREAEIARPPHTIQFITLDPTPGAYGVTWEW